MLYDFRAASTPAQHRVPLCIVGAGVAGLTLARRLEARGHSVLLVESGGVDHEPAVQRLAAGGTSGQPYYPLDRVNLRMLGGTTAIWGGRCAELDAIDLRWRDWVPHSGWPVSPADLEEALRQAADVFGILPPHDAKPQLLGCQPLLRRLDGDELAVDCWTFDDASDRFTMPHLGDLAASQRVSVLLHATAVELCLSSDGRRIERLEIADLSGRRGWVAAERFVLAMGGLETPRLLLNSDRQAVAGIGNGHDLVGRFFMEHPHTRGGRVQGPGVRALLGALGRSHHVGPHRLGALLRLSDAAQERWHTLNSSCTIAARPAEGAAAPWLLRTYSGLKHQLSPTRRNRILWRLAKGSALWLHERTDPLRPWLMVRAGLREAALVVRAEQAPNPDSRVTLSDQRDVLGMRQLHLDWRLSELDRHSVRMLVQRLDAALSGLQLGHAIAADWLEQPDLLWASDPTISAHPIGGYHHMGTVRIGSTPSTSVADPDCKVHGIDNLYIVGSSLFPTSGWANPTLTLVALAIRLAEHLNLSLPASKVAAPHAI